MWRFVVIAMLASACGTSSPTAPATFVAQPALEPAVSAAMPTILARWPSCTLAGWTLVGQPAPFTPTPGTLCGEQLCTGRVRGHTDTHTRQITVWAHDPDLVRVIEWEGCNACRWDRTGTLVDAGCGR